MKPLSAAGRAACLRPLQARPFSAHSRPLRHPTQPTLPNRPDRSHPLQGAPPPPPPPPPPPAPSASPSASARPWVSAFIAVGSNVGPHTQIHRALKLLESASGGAARVVRTSRLWRTKAMYVLDQDDFVNGACEIKTTLSPADLLSLAQLVENSLGRVKLVDKGPRCIDLDIILYGNEVVDTETLTIPHKGMIEREFVLRPLADLIPDARVPHPLATGTVKQHLDAISKQDGNAVLIFPFADRFLTPESSCKQTTVMGIYNSSPDSFSSVPGSGTRPISTAEIAERINSLDADIIDIGGQSTRPNAPFIPPEVEIERVVPAIRAARALNLPTSIDTFSSAVAAAALSEGVDVINDVTAGQRDPAILALAADAGVPIVLNHSRGTPATMDSLAQYPPDPAGLVHTVALELAERVRAAEAAGVRRWNIVLDPGLGFAKTTAQSAALLAHLSLLRAHPAVASFPWLVGPSRKRFVGDLGGVKVPAERRQGTAVAVAAAIQGGADIVRVHENSTEIVGVANGLWRVGR